MIDVGRMRKRITLLKQAEGEGDFGDTEQEWRPWRTMYATVHHKTSRERINNRKTEDETDYIITVRYYPYGYLIDSDMRIECFLRGKRRTLEIIGDPVEKEDSEFLEVSAREHRITEEGDLFE